jgi:hypothetical protein
MYMHPPCTMHPLRTQSHNRGWDGKRLCKPPAQTPVFPAPTTGQRLHPKPRSVLQLACDLHTYRRKIHQKSRAAPPCKVSDRNYNCSGSSNLGGIPTGPFCICTRMICGLVALFFFIFFYYTNVVLAEGLDWVELGWTCMSIWDLHLGLEMMLRDDHGDFAEVNSVVCYCPGYSMPL